MARRPIDRNVCTLAIAFDIFPGSPVVVAANRDERLDRPSRPPTKWEGSPAIIAPGDEEAGGTWIGYNDHGLFDAITSRWTETELRGDRSRGLLVRDALSQSDVDAAASMVERALRRDGYEGFFLVLADATAAVVLGWDGQLVMTTLDPGLHVVMNTGFDDRFDVPENRREAGECQIDSARLVRSRLAPAADETATEWLDRAAEVLGDHDIGVCVHGDGYGTRSSSLIAIGEDGRTEYRFADGPPCRTAFEPVNEP